MKKLILLIPFSLSAMEDPVHPRYHINGKIVYLKELHESGDQEFRTVSDFNKAIDRQNAIMTEVSESIQNRKEEVAVINNGMSNKTKVIIAALGAVSTVTVGILSSLATYYSKKCE